MLTVELIKSSAPLKSLSDEQLSAITQLSKNDEEQVIGQKVKEIHGQYDADIKELTGQEKPGGVKSYEHVKNVISALKKKADSAGDVKKLQSSIDSLTSERDDLLKKIKDGAGDEVLKNKIKSLEKTISDKSSEIDTLKTNYSTEKSALEKQLSDQQQASSDMEIISAFDKYVVENKLKFKTTIPDGLLKETLGHRKSQLLNDLQSDLIDDGNGGKVRVFRDAEGEILRNKNTNLNPYTAGELYAEKIADLLDTGRSQSGGGTNPTGPGGKTANIDISSAKNQIQANELITGHILKVEGIAKTDPRFAERQQEISTEYNVADLPFRGEQGE